MTTEQLIARLDAYLALEANTTAAPWKSFGKQAVVITEAKRDELTREVSEQGRIIFGSPGWVDDEDDNRVPCEEEVANCDFTAESRNLAPSMARALKVAIAAMQKECAKFNFPDEDRPIIHEALSAIAKELENA